MPTHAGTDIYGLFFFSLLLLRLLLFVFVVSVVDHGVELDCAGLWVLEAGRRGSGRGARVAWNTNGLLSSYRLGGPSMIVSAARCPDREAIDAPLCGSLPGNS